MRVYRLLGLTGNRAAKSDALGSKWSFQLGALSSIARLDDASAACFGESSEISALFSTLNDETPRLASEIDDANCL